MKAGRTLKTRTRRSRDVETPKTDAMIGKMLRAEGVPICEEWDRLVEHAREMERMAYAYRAVAVATSLK